MSSLPKILYCSSFVLFPHVKLASLWQAFSFLKFLYCSLLAYWPAICQCSPSPKVCIVPLWLVGPPLAGILLPKNFVLFSSGLLAGLRPASSFPKKLYCSLLACRPAFGWPPPSPKFGTGGKFFFVVSGKIASRTSRGAGSLRPPPARSVRLAQTKQS